MPVRERMYCTYHGPSERTCTHGGRCTCYNTAVFTLSLSSCFPSETTDHKQVHYRYRSVHGEMVEVNLDCHCTCQHGGKIPYRTHRRPHKVCRPFHPLRVQTVPCKGTRAAVTVDAAGNGISRKCRRCSPADSRYQITRPGRQSSHDTRTSHFQRRGWDESDEENVSRGRSRRWMMEVQRRVGQASCSHASKCPALHSVHTLLRTISCMFQNQTPSAGLDSE